MHYLIGSMNRCCHRQNRGRARLAAGAVVPGVLLALTPKCPVCLAGWAAVLGVAIPVTAAGWVRHVFIGLCLATILVSLIYFIRSICYRHVRRHTTESR